VQTTKPYLIRAIHEWCSDQGFTPYMAVKVDAFTRVPNEFVKEGEIVLNIGLDATHQLSLGNDEVTFQARFGGRAFPVVVPIERVAAIYARENGEGMAFEVSETRAEDSVDDGAKTAGASRSGAGPGTVSDLKSKSGRPTLTRIK
jgi:stringent starvation protein B